MGDAGGQSPPPRFPSSRRDDALIEQTAQSCAFVLGIAKVFTLFVARFLDGEADLLITDPDGKRLGYVDGKLINEIPGIICSEPPGAFYVFPDVHVYFGKTSAAGKLINDADELCMYLLNDAHVSSVSGKAFGEPDCIRLSFANSIENIEKGFAKIKNALAALK